MEWVLVLLPLVGGQVPGGVWQTQEECVYRAHQYTDNQQGAAKCVPQIPLVAPIKKPEHPAQAVCLGVGGGVISCQIDR